MLWVLVIFIHSQILEHTVDILLMNENSQIMTMIGTNYDYYFTQLGQSQYEVAF